MLAFLAVSVPDNSVEPGTLKPFSDGAVWLSVAGVVCDANFPGILVELDGSSALGIPKLAAGGDSGWNVLGCEESILLGPSRFKLKVGSAVVSEVSSAGLPVFELLLDGKLGNFVGESPIGGKLGMLVSLGGVSVLGGVAVGSLVDEPNVGAGPDRSPEVLDRPGLPPNGVPGFKPPLGVRPAESKLGIFISESLAMRF